MVLPENPSGHAQNTWFSMTVMHEPPFRQVSGHSDGDVGVFEVVEVEVVAVWI